jgi:hypothetical protein
MEIGSSYNLRIINHESDYFYISGRIGLKNILKTILYDNDKCIIPNYLCESIYNCFKNYDLYEITDALDINIKTLFKNIKSNNYKAIFIINYFGYIDKNIQLIKNKCKKYNIIIIEDFTHNLFSKHFYGDICISSYRKTLETPFGCRVIYSKKYIDMNKQFYYIDILYILFNLIKIVCMLIKNIRCLKIIWRFIFIYTENYIDNIKYNGFDYINHFFYKYFFNINNKKIRIKNMLYLFKNLKYKCDSKFLKTYFTYPIIFDTKNTRDKIKNILIKNKIYCPVYWPLDFDKNNLFNHNISDKILCIPIDQRYNETNMKYIVDIINNNC